MIDLRTGKNWFSEQSNFLDSNEKIYWKKIKSVQFSSCFIHRIFNYDKILYIFYIHSNFQNENRNIYVFTFSQILYKKHVK